MAIAIKLSKALTLISMDYFFILIFTVILTLTFNEYSRNLIVVESSTVNDGSLI